MSYRPSLSGFKHWIATQQDLKQFFDIEEENAKEETTGRRAILRCSESRLLKRMVTEVDRDVLAGEFVENGGEVISQDDETATIQVESGVFTIPLVYIKIKDR